MKIVQLMFDGELKECLITTDDNGEITCHAKDGQFVKFPAGTDIKEAAKLHNAANAEIPAFASDESDDELASWMASGGE